MAEVRFRPGPAVSLRVDLIGTACACMDVASSCVTLKRQNVTSTLAAAAPIADQHRVAHMSVSASHHRESLGANLPVLLRVFRCPEECVCILLYRNTFV